MQPSGNAGCSRLSDSMQTPPKLHGGLQMKKNYWIILGITLALALGVYVIPGTAQQQAAAPQLPFQVAVVDLAQVIRAHPDFLAAQAQLQEEVRQAAAHFQAARDQIEAEERRIQGMDLRPNSDEHQRLVADLTRRVADFEANFRAQHRRFALREAQIMYDTHRNIKDTIARYAQARNIAQVTDFRCFDVDPADPATVAEDMDQRLVWFSPQLNITPFIVQQLYADRPHAQMPESVRAALQNRTRIQ